MKRRFVFWLALAAMAMRILAPVAAHASAPTMPGFGTICSAYGTASPADQAPPSAPMDGHLLACCADCDFGGGIGILPTSAALPPVIAKGPLPRPAALRTTAAAAPELLPPPRGPPDTVEA